VVDSPCASLFETESRLSRFRRAQSFRLNLDRRQIPANTRNRAEPLSIAPKADPKMPLCGGPTGLKVSWLSDWNGWFSCTRCGREPSASGGTFAIDLSATLSNVFHWINPAWIAACRGTLGT
jgi:hypothetical protein